MDISAELRYNIKAGQKNEVKHNVSNPTLVDLPTVSAVSASPAFRFTPAFLPLRLLASLPVRPALAGLF